MNSTTTRGLAGCLLVCAIAGSGHAAPVITRVSNPPGTESSPFPEVGVRGLTNNGCVLAVSSSLPSTPEHPQGVGTFRWCPGSGYTLIPNIKVINVETNTSFVEPISGWAMSQDGQRIVGDTGIFVRPFSWTPGGGSVYLPTGSQNGGRAIFLSEDGLTAVGFGPYDTLAMWTPSGYTSYGSAILGWASIPTGISPDASKVVGYVVKYNAVLLREETRGFLWTNSGGFMLLPGLDGFILGQEPAGVRSDAGMIVGTEFTQYDRQNHRRPHRAFIWTPEAGTVGVVGEYDTQDTLLNCLSADGSVAGGSLYDAYNQRYATLLTTNHGFIRLEPYLRICGVDLTGIELYEVKAVSPDGHALLVDGATVTWVQDPFVPAYSSFVKRLCPFVITGLELDKPKPCGRADITDGFGAGIPDGHLSAGDVVMFFQSFFTGCTTTAVPCSPADTADASGTGRPDGQIKGADAVAYIQSFFAGCGQ